ncbi:hypothetical protein EVAR_196_1 [Eumeta japonica]|uniref:Uncharacterized protein n=1 Tax=Eumeta variegata TaxID=151549 RepID=A0A4C1S8T4_EUMVA|nr:hypothetical protein EVAR_196_1 [Eumeta japonica]
MGGECGERGESGTPALSVTGRKEIVVAVTSRLYSVRVSCKCPWPAMTTYILVVRENFQYALGTHRIEPTKSLPEGFKSFQKALQSIADDETQALQAIHEGELFDACEMQANEKTDTEYSDENQRVRRKKSHHDDEFAEEVVCLYQYRQTTFVYNTSRHFMRKANDEIKEANTKYSERYYQDIEPDFVKEMVLFKHFILQLEDAGIAKKDKIVPA